MTKHLGSDWMMSKVRLGQDVLAEFPSQFLRYMKMKGLKPPSSGIVSPSLVPSS